MKRIPFVVFVFIAFVVSCSAGETSLETSWNPEPSPESWFKFNAVPSIVGFADGAGEPQDICLPGKYNSLLVFRIEENAFKGCEFLKRVAISEPIIAIGDHAFDSCSSMTLVIIPSSVGRIGRSAFSRCNSLASVIIHNGVTEICENAFELCDSLVSIEIPSSVESIGEWAFADCSFRSIEIPSSVTEIGNHAFYDNIYLSKLRFLGTVSQWENVEKGESWHKKTKLTKVICSDGEVSL